MAKPAPPSPTIDPALLIIPALAIVGLIIILLLVHFIEQRSRMMDRRKGRARSEATRLARLHGDGAAEKLSKAIRQSRPGRRRRHLKAALREVKSG